jgi:LmbE family N-acetylglucosaminyl deacetylase
MKILVIAPHPDDEVIGPGGTLIQHVRQGDSVTAVFVTSGELGLKTLPRERAWTVREAEARAAGRILGMDQLVFLRQPDWMVGDHLGAAVVALRPHLRATAPDRIYLPHPNDGHPDHRVCWRLVRRALRGVRGAKPELWGYEVWTPIEQPDQVHDISAVMPVKLRALRAHRSQLNEFDYVAAMRGLNAFRGALSGRCAHAEAFRRLG